MPVSRIERNLKKGRYANRISPGSAVYMAAVLEYLTAEMMEMAGNAARDNKRGRIAPRHLMMAIRNDEEMSELLKDVVIPEAGVVPFIHEVLLPTRSNKRETEVEVESQEL